MKWGEGRGREEKKKVQGGGQDGTEGGGWQDGIEGERKGQEGRVKKTGNLGLCSCPLCLPP